VKKKLLGIISEHIKIMSDTLTGQAGNCILRIQFFHIAIFLGKNTGGYGSRLFIFAPNKNKEWKCNKFSYSHSFKKAQTKKS
jgi:hypothetical protein